MFSLEPVSRSDLYYITGRASICQQLFQKNLQKNPASSKRALLRRDDAGFRHPFQSFSFSHSVVDPTASQRQDGFRAPISRTFRVSLCVDDDIVIGFGDLVVATRRAATLKVAHDGRTCTRAELSQRSSTLCMSAASQTTRRDRHRHGEERREEVLSWISFCPYSHLILSPPARQGALPTEPTMPR